MNPSDFFFSIDYADKGTSATMRGWWGYTDQRGKHGPFSTWDGAYAWICGQVPAEWVAEGASTKWA